MSEDEKQRDFHLGFLAAVEVPDHGYMGGLLVTNHLGRPLEFQCTTPVKPNRTQEILYGPTLAPFLLGELIGCTLVEKAAVKPNVILTEQEEILELRNHVPLPVACLIDSAPDGGPTQAPMTSEESASSRAREEAELPNQGLTRNGLAALGRQTLQFHEAHRSDSRVVAERASAVPREADLREPFQRVRDALNEALGSGAKR